MLICIEMGESDSDEELIVDIRNETIQSDTILDRRHPISHHISWRDSKRLLPV